MLLFMAFNMSTKSDHMFLPILIIHTHTQEERNQVEPAMNTVSFIGVQEL